MTTAIGVCLTLLLAAPDAGVRPVDLSALTERVDALATELTETREELADVQDTLEATKEELQSALAAAKLKAELDDERRAFSLTFGAYLDVGFFFVQGDGSGVRTDLNQVVTGSEGLLRTWVFRGDPLATAINSRGEAADLGASRALGFDGLQTRGRPTVLINALNLQLNTQLSDELSAFAMVDLLPRERTFTHFALGDFIDVKQAWLSWRRKLPVGTFTVWAGKVDSVLGYEYRFQESPQRLTITPSLLCRYTCGRALGVRAKGQFASDRLEVLLAVTNGNNQLELMPWGGEGNFNLTPTVSGRVGVLLPVSHGLEIATSAMLGVQERQADPTVLQFHVAAMARLDLGLVTFTAEGMFGKAVGKTGSINGTDVPCAAASCLDYRGAYLLVGVRATHWLVPYARFDWRSGTMRNGREWMYESTRLRGTVGLRFEPVHRLQLKAEYVINRELVGPDFPDDIFTTSAVVSY